MSLVSPANQCKDDDGHHDLTQFYPEVEPQQVDEGKAPAMREVGHGLRKTKSVDQAKRENNGALPCEVPLHCLVSKERHGNNADSDQGLNDIGRGMINPI